MHNIGTVGSILEGKGHAVWSIAPEAKVFDALKLLAEKNVGALLVMSEGRLIGLVSERDYARKIALLGKHSNETPVRDIITSQVITVPSEASVAECMRLMTEHHIRHLPVVDEGRVVGVISIGDLVNWIIKSQSATIDELQKYITGEYSA